MCGNQAKSTLRSQPSIGFGQSTREVEAKRFITDEHKTKDNVLQSKHVPGPGAYQHPITTGKQPESSRPTVPVWKFGSSVRFDGIEAKRTGAVPGPGAYFV
jgi:hypothetical protein